MIYGRCALGKNIAAHHEFFPIFILAILSVFLLFSICGSVPISKANQPLRLEPDCYRNVTELIKSKGYICEEHNGYHTRWIHSRCFPYSTRSKHPSQCKTRPTHSSSTWSARFKSWIYPRRC